MTKRWLDFGFAAKKIAAARKMNIGLAEITLRELCKSGEVHARKRFLEVHGAMGVRTSDWEPIAPREWRADEVDWQDHVTVEIDEDLLDDWIRRQSTEPRGRKRVRPQRELAEWALELLYPDGVPSMSALPNKKLCARVNDCLKEHDHPLPVGEDSILRAAGRK
jgi:hypothetical protein